MNRRNFNKLIFAGALSTGLPYSKIGKMKSNQGLQAGDKIALITPSGPITKSKLETAIENMKQLGLVPIYDNQVLDKDGYLAGSDKQRLDGLHQAFANKKIKGVWCIRGGYGATRFLDQINLNLIKANRKPLIGYSDITALLNTIQQQTGNPCYHGPVAGSKFYPYTMKHLAPLFHPNKEHTISLSSDNEKRAKEEEIYRYTVIHDGVAEGKLVGGNLSLLVSLIGTKHQVKTKKKLVFIEDIGEQPYRVDRMLTQLISAGFFDKVSGVIFGIFAGCERKDENSWTLLQVIKDRMSAIQKPVVYGFSFGHIRHQCTFPIGSHAILDTQKKTLQLQA